MMAKVFGSKEMRLLMLGLDAAGKTSTYSFFFFLFLFLIFLLSFLSEGLGVSGWWRRLGEVSWGLKRRI